MMTISSFFWTVLFRIGFFFLKIETQSTYVMTRSTEGAMNRARICKSGPIVSPLTLAFIASKNLFHSHDHLKPTSLR